jgi:sterol desaturase/sphingolipid hydroxylase (fatty acid hydroxylase superfamily)
VHHSCNETCLDKNYGSVLIVFDRWFGTFAAAPRGEPLRFGLQGRANSNNPLVIALGEWRHLIRDAARARGVRARLKVLFGWP